MHFSLKKYRQISKAFGRRQLVVAAMMLVAFCLPLSLSAQITETFTSNGTFTVPAGVTEITVQLWGGGGAGGGAKARNGNPNDRSGGGGAGGTYTFSTINVTPGENIPITVGDGGTGVSGADGNSGGTSSFGTYASAIGGEGGIAGINGSRRGAGAPASIGVTYNGGGGARAPAINQSGGGGGSAGTLSDGNNASGTTGGASVTDGGSGANGRTTIGNGQPASFPGGGGSGGYTNTTTSYAGGAGAGGLVIISYTPTSPTFSVSPTSIDFGFVASGSNDTQTFTLTGSNLDGTDVTITGSSDFQVSTDGSTFSNSVTISGYGTSISQDIYVQFAPSAANTNYSDNIVISGGGAADDGIVAVSGNSIIQYCESEFTDVSFEYITNVNFAGINNPSGADVGGPVDYTNIIFYVQQGATEQISVTITADYSDYIYAFIDWNQNGTLNDAGEVYTIAANTDLDGPHLLNINVPIDASIGNTRMRVMVDWDNALPDPCRDATYGEAEDYTINVSPALPTVSFTSATQSSSNESGTMIIVAELSETYSSDVTVPFTVNASSTAQGIGVDYSITASPLTITTGNTTANITITITSDTESEDDETVIVDMGTPTNAVQGAITSHTATITDDDPGFIITESGGSTQTSETGTTDAFTVVLKTQPTTNVVIDITSGDTSEGTVSPSTLTFTNGNWDSPQSVTVTGIDDAVIDGDITYNISVSVNVGGSDASYSSVPSQTVSATNTDDDIPPCITAHPDTVTVCVGENTSFSITTTASNYQWQVNTGSGWNNITTGGFNPNYSGYNSATLSLTNVVAGNNGYLYRCVVSGGCSETSEIAALYVGIDKYGPLLSVSEQLIDTGESTTLYLSNTQAGLNYQLNAAGSPVGSPVAGNGGTITFTPVSPTSSTNYTVDATSASSGCNSDLIDQLTVIVNEDDLIIDLNPCAGQPGANFFTNSEFGTTSTNFFSEPDPVDNPGVIFGNPLGSAYTDYTFGFSNGEVEDGYYVIANSTNGMFNDPGNDGTWLNIYDNTQGDGTGHMYIVNASFTPGNFYTETLTGLCDSTKYEFSADIINLYASNWFPNGTDYETWFNEDDQGNFYSLLPNIDFLINGKVAYNTGNIMNDGNWQTVGFTFRTGGLTNITLTMRNNSTGGIGNDIALDNIVIRPCGPEIELQIETTLPVCPGTPVGLTANIVASDYNSPVYQWQTSTDGGTSWSDIAGATTTQYTENNPVYGHQYRYKTAETTEALGSPTCYVASEAIEILTTADILSTSNDTICDSGIATLEATANSGSTINWYNVPTGGSSQGTGGTFVTSTITETDTMYVDATQSGCTSSPRQMVIAVVNPRPIITSTTPGSTCGTGTVELEATTSTGTLNWFTTSTGGTSIGSGSPWTTPSISSTTTYYVEANNEGCISSSRTPVTAYVYAAAPNTPGAITGSSPLCAFESETYSISAVTNATTYNWTVPTGWTITSGQGTTSITVVSGDYGDNGDITVIASNGCGSSPGNSTLPVVVSDNEDPQITSAGNHAENANSTGCTYSHSGITWDASVTDNCDTSPDFYYTLSGATVGGGAPSFPVSLDGVVFNEDTTFVTWTATDDFGNSSNFIDTVVVRSIEATVTLTSLDYQCPELLSVRGFNPQNDFYDPGATEVRFEVGITNSDAVTWEFDYDIDISTPVRTDSPASPNPQSDSNVPVSGVSNTELIFYIQNIPGDSISPVIEIFNVEDGYGCTTIETVSDSVHIKAMPAVGLFD